MDLALAWYAPLYKAVAPYVRFAITNLFDTHYLLAFDSSVTPNDGRTVAGVTHPTGPLDANGLPTTFTKGPAFGTATSSINYQAARTLSVAAGIRF